MSRGTENRSRCGRNVLQDQNLDNGMIDQGLRVEKLYEPLNGVAGRADPLLCLVEPCVSINVVVPKRHLHRRHSARLRKTDKLANLFGDDSGIGPLEDCSQ
jgi:hypothetical protein